jgi:hypothetical protein
MTDSSVHPAPIYSLPSDFRLHPPAFTACLVCQLSSGNTPTGNLSFCCCTVLRSVKTQNYANQSESGEARVAGSNSGGGGHTPFFMR